MFDIGFAELVVVALVGLLVIGPERLPGALRTLNLWLTRLRRGFNDIKREVEQELHNDAVMQELREAGEQLRDQTDGLGRDLEQAAEAAIQSLGKDGAPAGKSSQVPGGKME